MNKHLLVVAMAAALVPGLSGSGPAQAQGFDMQTIVSGNGAPVVLNQSSQFNLAGIFQIGGTTSATVVQNGNGNATGILQFGNTNGASVSQTGGANFTFIGQVGQLNNSSAVTQLGGFLNSSIIKQTSP